MPALDGAERFVRTSDPPFLRPGRSASIAFLVWGCVAIACWQSYSILYPETIDRDTTQIFGLKGAYGARAQKYFYFYYYKDLFPVTVKGRASRLDWSSAGADRAVDGGRQLHMEDWAYVRTGDLGKIWLLYPHVWIHGTPESATLHAANRVLGVASLLALFLALSLANYRLLAVVLVAFLGSNPAQLVQIYVENNVFGLPIAVASLLLAAHVPLILRGRTKGYYWIALASGALLASVREIRPEPALVIASVVVVYGFAPGGWRRRGALLALLAVGFVGTGQLWTVYWSSKFDEAHRVVDAAGGVTFDGPRNRHHALWHSLWAGLGDFDEKYGYEFDDLAAYDYGIPEVNRRFGRSYTRSSTAYQLDQFHTPAKKHRIIAETLDEYLIVLRDKVVHDVRNDPLWFADIIRKRVGRVLSRTTPIRVAVGEMRLDFPFTAWLVVPVLAALVVLRRWGEIQLLLFYLPTSASTILIFSGHGFPYASAYHIVLAALLVCWLVNLALLRPDESEVDVERREP